MVDTEVHLADFLLSRYLKCYAKMGLKVNPRAVIVLPQDLSLNLDTETIGSTNLRGQDLLCLKCPWESCLISQWGSPQRLGRGSGSESMACSCHGSGRECSFRTWVQSMPRHSWQWESGLLLGWQTSKGSHNCTRQVFNSDTMWRQGTTAATHQADSLLKGKAAVPSQHKPLGGGQFKGEEITGLIPMIYVRVPVNDRQNKREQIHHLTWTHMFALSLTVWWKFLKTTFSY